MKLALIQFFNQTSRIFIIRFNQSEQVSCKCKPIKTRYVQIVSDGIKTRLPHEAGSKIDVKRKKSNHKQWSQYKLKMKKKKSKNQKQFKKSKKRKKAHETKDYYFLSCDGEKYYFRKIKIFYKHCS